MAVFEYIGKSREGKTLEGEVTAPTSQEALHRLRSQDLLIMHLQEKRVEPVRPQRRRFSWNTHRVTNKEVVILTHQFATLLRAGVPLLECLEILGTEVENPAWHPILTDIRADIEHGIPLAEALGKFPTIFQRFYRSMVEVGEATGRLDESLSQLAVYLDKQVQLRAKILSALAYPGLLMSVASMVFVFLLVWVVPLFSGLFQEFGESLPWLTKVVISLAGGIREHVLILIGLVLSVMLGSYFLLTHMKSRQVIDGLLLRLPLLGALFRKAAIVRFARTLGFLIRRGVPLLTALSVAGTVTGNSIIERHLQEVATDVEDGRPLSDTLRATGMFPAMVTQMVKVGESTGSLDLMLEKIADLFEQEVDRVIATVTSVLEPCVLVVVGSGIALVVVAMYLPIFSIGSVIG